MVGRNRLGALLLVAAVLPAGFAPGATPRPAVPSGFSENFDGVIAPSLPAGWVTTHSPGTGALWVTDTTNPDTAPNAASLSEGTAPFEDILDSAPISITTTSAQLRFRHNYSFFVDLGGAPQPSSPTDFCPTNLYFSSGRLQISMNGGEFQDILAAGGSFIEGDYHEGVERGCATAKVTIRSS